MSVIIAADDTHRCPTVGSLVVAGVAADEKTIKYFKRIGVKDSKLLERNRRFYLLTEIAKRAKIAVKFITPMQISRCENLNDEEAKAYMDVIEQLSGQQLPVKVIIDNFDRNKAKFIERMRRLGFHSYADAAEGWTIEHDADKNYTLCGAASIVAKCFSDIEMDYLRRKYDVGSGNPNDPKTEKFIIKHLKCEPKCRKGCQWIRWNWHTIERLRNSIG